MTEKFIIYLEQAEKIIKTVDHMTYVTFPLIKDKQLLLKILLETKTAVANCINSILQYDYIYKRVRLYSDPKENLRIFMQKSAPRCEITKQELDLIVELFDLVEKHKQSTMAFKRNDKIIILSADLKPETITLERTKGFLLLAKSVCQKVREKITKYK
jgi:hypothetical protein